MANALLKVNHYFRGTLGIGPNVRVGVKSAGVTQKVCAE